MTTYEDVTERIDQRHELMSPEMEENLIRLVAGVAGAKLLLYGVRRLGITGTLATGVGAGLLYRALSGCNPLAMVMGEEEFEAEPEQAPSYPRDEQRAGQMPLDEVDEASMESFPASDAPAYTTRSREE